MSACRAESNVWPWFLRVRSRPTGPRRRKNGPSEYPRGIPQVDPKIERHPLDNIIHGFRKQRPHKGPSVLYDATIDEEAPPDAEVAPPVVTGDVRRGRRCLLERRPRKGRSGATSTRLWTSRVDAAGLRTSRVDAAGLVASTPRRRARGPTSSAPRLRRLCGATSRGRWSRRRSGPIRSAQLVHEPVSAPTAAPKSPVSKKTPSPTS